MTTINRSPSPAVAGSTPTSAAAPVEETPAAAPAADAQELPADTFDTTPSTTRSQENLPQVPVRADLAAEVNRRRFASAGSGSLAPTTLTKVTNTDGSVLIKGTDANDKISVTPGKNGGVTVTAGKNKIELTDEEAKHLTIDAGKGNDIIEVDPKVTYDLTLKGGEGDDLIRGGGGKDKIYGGAGRDVIYAGDKGDTIDGGAGDDVIYGGKGGDTITGGAGKNVVIAGTGKNTIGTEGGNDRVYANKGDRIAQVKNAPTGGKVARVDVNPATGKPPGSSITVEGSPEFKAKVQRELDALRSTETGRKLLNDIDAHPDKPVRIKEGSDEAVPDSEADSMTKGLKLSPKGKPSVTGTGKGSGSTVTFDPDLYRARDTAAADNTPADEDDAFDMPPAVALFHELVHANRSQNGESAGLTMKEEYETAGTIDRTDPDEQKRFGGRFTENQLRQELGLPDRRYYEQN